MGKLESPLDVKQGRIVLEQHLLDYAGIKKKSRACVPALIGESSPYKTTG